MEQGDFPGIRLRSFGSKGDAGSEPLAATTVVPGREDGRSCSSVSIPAGCSHHLPPGGSQLCFSDGLLAVVPRDVVYSREAGVAPRMPPCGRR